MESGIADLSLIHTELPFNRLNSSPGKHLGYPPPEINMAMLHDGGDVVFRFNVQKVTLELI